MNFKLRERIRNLYRTQADFSQALGIHDSVVSRVINGRHKLSEGEEKRWANMLKCRKNEIFGL